MADDNFEAAWPKDGDACPCSQTQQGRAEVIDSCMKIAELVLAKMQEAEICPTMYPHALGFVNSFALGWLEQSLSPDTRGVSLLQFPNALQKLDVVEKSARCLMLAAQEGSSARN